MKLGFLPSGFKSLSRTEFSRALLYSTETQTSAIPNDRKDHIFRKISPIGDPRVSILPILDQWVKEGNTFNKRDLKGMIAKLKGYKRFTHALEISQWMTERRYFLLSVGDTVVRLNLISKVHGIVQAEKYFDSIPKQCKDFKVYNGLLNCYALWKSIEKAETLVQQMKELGFALSSLTYNTLLSMYIQVGQHEKIGAVMEEMKETGITPDIYTFRILLGAYATTANIDEMEKVLHRMEVDPDTIMDWNIYATVANGYIKAGLNDKGLEMLQKSEEAATETERNLAYDHLLTLYAAAGKKDDLYRIWNLYKSSGEIYNKAYRSMISSLLKLDDIAGTEKILEEWESANTTYDFRVPNLLIAAYCKTNQLEKAEMYVKKAIAEGKKPFANTWGILAAGYMEAKQFPEAVEAIQAALLARDLGWKPDRDTVAACLVYLKEQGDAEKTAEFVRLLGAPGHMSTDDCERLLDYVL